MKHTKKNAFTTTTIPTSWGRQMGERREKGGDDVGEERERDIL